MTNTSSLEKLFSGNEGSASRYGKIEKKTPRQFNNFDIYIPVAWSLSLGTMTGLSAFVGLAFTVADVKTAAMAGTITFCAVSSFIAYQIIRNYPQFVVSSEEYTSETLLLAQSENSRTTLEIVDKQNGVIRYDQFPIGHDELISLFNSVTNGQTRLSRNGVSKALGCADERAGQVLEALEGQNYIVYPNNRNSPQGAQFTKKGKTVCESLLTSQS